MAKFKGFNTIGRTSAPFTLTDDELVKRDLLNEFYTRRGERLMRPNFGSIIWDLLMDPSTQDVDNAIREDIIKIIDRDPRVEHVNTDLAVLDHAIRAQVTIKMLPVGNPEQLYIEYQREITEGVD